MKIKETHRKVIRDTFFYLLMATILISVYRHFNPFSFPRLQMKLVIVTIIFGIVWIYSSFVSGEKIEFCVKEVKAVKKRLMIFLIGFIFYSFFLNWVYNRLSFDEFAFFILLLYIPISCILGLESRIPIVIALLLLVSCAITLAYGYENHANRIAIYAYYFLVIGVVLMFVDYLRESSRS